jgi:hypothetical protein
MVLALVSTGLLLNLLLYPEDGEDIDLRIVCLSLSLNYTDYNPEDHALQTYKPF